MVQQYAQCWKTDWTPAEISVPASGQLRCGRLELMCDMCKAALQLSAVTSLHGLQCRQLLRRSVQPLCQLLALQPSFYPSMLPAA